MKSLILYSTIVGGFFAQTEALEAAIAAAREEAGDDVWKRGFSGSDPRGATAVANRHLKKAGIKAIPLEGDLVYVAFVENKDDAGNRYPKLRVGMEYLEDQYMLSLDIKSDVAQRLIVKLDNCQPGEYVRLSAWPTMVVKGNRTFINHALSMKNAEGKEVPANTTFSAGVKQQTEGVAATLRAAGIMDEKVIATAKATKRVDAHKELLQAIESRFIAAGASA